MKDLLENFNQKLIQLNEEEKFENIYIRKHFFFNAIEYVYNSITIKEKMELMYRFHSFEKILQLCRTDQFVQAKYKIDYLDYCRQDLPLTAENSIKALYYPMLSFYYYTKKDYQLAKDTLNECFPFIEYLVDNNVPDACLVGGEQLLNLIRVNAVMKDYDEAIENTAKLISFSWTGIENDKLKGDVRTILDNEELTISCLKYFTDNSVKKLIREFGDEKILQQEIVTRLFTDFELNDSSTVAKIPVYTNVSTLFKTYLQDANEQNFLTGIYDNLVDFPKLPDMFQFILLQYANKIIEKNADSDDFEVINQNLKIYNLTKLEITDTKVEVARVVPEFNAIAFR